jgi:hypothetical protein
MRMNMWRLCIVVIYGDELMVVSAFNLFMGSND